MPITTREELKQYCLRKLGEPVIKVNVADEQLDDRIEEALDYFYKHHEHGVERMFFVHTVTQQNIDDKFIDIDTIEPRIVEVSRLISASDGMDSNSFMNALYNYKKDVYAGLYSTSNAQDYYVAMQHLDTIERIFESGTEIDFNKNSRKLRILDNWQDMVAGETKLGFECMVRLDESSDTKLFEDTFVKNYATVLIKQQWGENLKKLRGVKLAGGVEIDGQSIYDEAIAEKKELEDDAGNIPLGMFFG